ncbi:MAG TPA: bifunctional glycosyltransferase/class I SAM-dependent methyltransferase [bacterium]|nr:bifunctional glycosyltransferase/class I SAM-dependent methyltransferase [bacterium]
MEVAAQPPVRPRLLILVVAYYAESTLSSVLERIPSQVHRDYDCEVLVIDDGSDDRTLAVGDDYRRGHPELNVTVLRNSYNQGYGGNQKVGYRYAISGGFDLVAVLHGDGQYAPEALPGLLQPFREARADAVFGSRMMPPRAALKGGMPLYKFAGNRILTWLENRLLRTHLSEFHSGYRIYSVPMLAKLPFLLNTNDFHFDTEIIIQLVNSGARIVELPIPTYYGDEICRVNGIRYAGNVLMAVLRNAAHRSGIFYERRFDCTGDGNTRYDLKLGYPSSHSYALQAVPTGVSVLDLGGGPGGMARELANKGCMVAVVDRFEPPERLPGIEFHVQDLDCPLDIDARRFRYILMLDIIEHLRHPELFLDRLRSQFDYAPRTIILTAPNVAFFAQRIMLLFGQFNYGSAGILDRTHCRLYTFRGVRHLLRDAGFRIRTIRGIPGPFPKALGDGWFSRFLLGVNLAMIRVSKTLFSYQVFVVADGTPDVDFVLADARHRSEVRDGA